MKRIASLVLGSLMMASVCYANSIEGKYDWLSKPNDIEFEMEISDKKFFISKADKGWDYKLISDSSDTARIVVFEYNEEVNAKQMILEKHGNKYYIYRESPKGTFYLIGIATRKK